MKPENKSKLGEKMKPENKSDFLKQVLLGKEVM